MPNARFTPPEDALDVISALLDTGDELDALEAVDKYLVEKCGLPHIDPIDTFDVDPAKVFIIWTRLAGRDWFQHHVGEIDDIIAADITDLYDWLNKEHRD
jgi:hypothetical protein